MPKRVAMNKLNATTIDILNTIRANASFSYQQQVPTVTQEQDIPKVGDVLVGYPALANEFINALVNRIALVRVKSATFNNQYAALKKGYLEFGETVEEVFVNIAKAREFSAEKAAAREFKRTLPDVRSAFHTMNWKVQYPVTIQDQDLRMAFTSFSGVQDLIARITNSVYTAAEYDEFLLFKYMLIKAISHGKMYPVAVDTSTPANAAKAFRGMSNLLPFMGTKYNAEGVTTTTPREDQYIFMDAQYNAAYDVDVLASAFNMDKATFQGKLHLIDDWNTFDNDRFAEIRANSTMVEEVTAEELNLMKDVIAVLVDGEWFQVYDNLTNFTEQYVASGMYWNYFLNIWKTVSSSPFSNAVVFVKNTANVAAPATIPAKVTDIQKSDIATIYVIEPDDATGLNQIGYQFVQTEQLVKDGVGVQRYGAYLCPTGKETVASTSMVIHAAGKDYTADVGLSVDTTVGTAITFSPAD